MTTWTYVDPQPNTGLFPGQATDDIRVMARVAAAFAPHENTTPNMTVLVDAGAIFDGAVLTEVAQQTSSVIVGPATNPRIDRVVLDSSTGVLQIVTGTEAASPVAPTIPASCLPIARIQLTTSTTQITNAEITDERISSSTRGGGRGLLNVQRFLTSGTYTPTAGTAMVIVEGIGGGGGGGGCAATGAGQVSIGGGGGAGSYGRAIFSAGFAGVTVTVGAGVNAGAAGAAGSAGGATSFGSLLSIPGGFGGTAGQAVTPPTMTYGTNAALSPTGANLAAGNGVQGFVGFALSTNLLYGGRGGHSSFAAGSAGSFGAGTGPATVAGNNGSGGSGAANGPSSAARPGGASSNGWLIVYEYG